MRDWKAAERRIARMLGGERVPVSGRSAYIRGSSPDVTHPELSIEVKTRASLPGWIEDAMRHAEAAATVEASTTNQPPKTPVTVLHHDRKPYRESLVLLLLDAFADLIQLAGERSSY